ncbi:LacI family DNA-binding transcriptional regulator [Bifidobacterium sp. 82T10]|uniref:LacI family DNA-binding transcriptional regulator n=1 Tax=Bifidobacterium miconis TaxID=2834435 RepID=A0ABS6WHN3_9BIFI|nr:LacI family DNA-binding transcriptional regulator [Bifidobacterium miconis]MBW3093563.1 LacI family DNA-binding transcriptional regulator [Bifidobacterium miconis]
MPTLKDVAAKAGVSLSTAGAAMRGEDIVKPATKERVLTAAKDLGYSPNLSARFLKKGRTDTIAVMVPNILHPYYTHLAYAICEEASRHGLRTVIQQTGYTQDSETNVLEQVNATLCDGLILNVSNVDEQHLRALLGNHPTVLLNYRSNDPLFDNVQPPQTHGIDIAFGYLQGRGYRNIAVVGARRIQPDDPDISGQKLAILHTMSLLTGSGLGTADDIVPCVWDITGGLEAARALCEPDADGTRRVDRYDVFYCMNDLIAYGLIRGLYEAGVRVPQDKAVFGHDGIQQEPYSIPTLSTIAVDFDDMARKAVSMLIEQIRHPDRRLKPRTETVECRLAIGESA